MCWSSRSVDTVNQTQPPAVFKTSRRQLLLTRASLATDSPDIEFWESQLPSSRDITTSRLIALLRRELPLTAQTSERGNITQGQVLQGRWIRGGRFQTPPGNRQSTTVPSRGNANQVMALHPSRSGLKNNWPTASHLAPKSSRTMGPASA